MHSLKVSTRPPIIVGHSYVLCRYMNSIDHISSLLLYRTFAQYSPTVRVHWNPIVDCSPSFCRKYIRSSASNA